MPFLDEYETFRAWRKALNDWQAANAGAAEVHKIQERRDQFRVRKENKPNAILFWQRFEKTFENFLFVFFWGPLLAMKNQWSLGRLAGPKLSKTVQTGPKGSSKPSLGTKLTCHKKYVKHGKFVTTVITYFCKCNRIHFQWK